MTSNKRTWNRHGAVSYYIILGIVILFVAMFLVFTNSTLMEGFAKLLNIDTKPSHNYVQECITDRAKDGLRLFATHGSTITDPMIFLEDQGTKIKYYSSSDQYPTMDKVKEEYQKYLSEYLPVCIRRYNNLSINKLAMDTYSIDVFFGLDETHIELRNIFNQEEGTVNKKAPDISIELPVRYMVVHNIAAAIKESRETSGYTEYIRQLKDYNGINVTWTRLDGYDLYLIEDSKSEINDEVFKYTLLIK
ncbi:hypothetical protein K9M79_08630 [Candidatus Woesearchaeota archaeon]|nr:hypothetical protein [Candidatus Woesearchaeota archaeon]